MIRDFRHCMERARAAAEWACQYGDTIDAVAVAALLLGFMVTPALMSKRPVISGAARVFVDGMRCVPFLLFAYIVYYGLPSLGLRLDNWTSGLAALTIYNAAYMAEILRGAWAVQPREPIEGRRRLRLFGLPAVSRIILPPLLLSAGPVIGNQMIQIIKDSAFLTIIALPELTHAASSIQSRHYIPFAAFITAVVLVLGALPCDRGRGEFDRPRRRSTPIGTRNGGIQQGSRCSWHIEAVRRYRSPVRCQLPGRQGRDGLRARTIRLGQIDAVTLHQLA